MRFTTEIKTFTKAGLKICIGFIGFLPIGFYRSHFWPIKFSMSGGFELKQFKNLKKLIKKIAYFGLLKNQAGLERKS
ncbi:MAG TPA: hypothetical protein VEC37_03815 [Bacillota bacterium]|nr:hypothetical protein [Bacillota bacterium]